MTEDFVEYHYWQGQYIALMLKKEEYKGYLDYQYIAFFPSDWGISRNYKRKIEILKKAIKLNTCIVEMEEALEFEERVILDNKKEL